MAGPCVECRQLLVTGSSREVKGGHVSFYVDKSVSECVCSAPALDHWQVIKNMRSPLKTHHCVCDARWQTGCLLDTHTYQRELEPDAIMQDCKLQFCFIMTFFPNDSLITCCSLCHGPLHVVLSQVTCPRLDIISIFTLTFDHTLNVKSGHSQ